MLGQRLTLKERCEDVGVFFSPFGERIRLYVVWKDLDGAERGKLNAFRKRARGNQHGGESGCDCVLDCGAPSCTAPG